MSPSYPLTLDVAGRRVVVVGGGPVAARRISGLVLADAEVTVIAPFACEAVTELAAAGSVTWLPREYRSGDLAGAWLVQTITGDRRIDTAVAGDAEADRIWCVKASDASTSAAWTPAVAEADAVKIAVSGGGDPGRAARVRNAVQSALDSGDITLRRTRPGSGHVALVGGGPGDPDLVTTRGRRLLAAADVVVTDRLAPTSLLDSLDPDVVVIDVGKAPGHHPVPQDEINRLLVEHATAGRRVVRLKGGDPYLLGRGGEEAAFCRDAGVPVEVVPGVTSAVAVPAAAGIPVTHRGIAKQFTVVSGHEGLDWPSLATVEGTLVLLMGVSRIADTAAQLIAHGKAPATPVAIIEDGYGPSQRTTIGALDTIAQLAAERDVRPPAVIVVGHVVTLARGPERSM